MDGVVSTTFWCVLQVSLIAIAGIATSLVLARRNVLAACSSVTMAVLIAAALTSVAPLPVHHWLRIESTANDVAESTLKPLPIIGIPDESLNARENGTPVDPMLNLRALAESLRSLAKHAGTFERHRTFSIQVAIWLFGAGILLGLLRLVIGIKFVLRIRHNGVPFTDVKLASFLNELASNLKCRTVPLLLEKSPEFTDAAVAGWFHPAIILPSNWHHWTDEECRAVLAHELAHIARQDSLWRMVASCLLAVHFYNPLMHWLLRRVELCQELSADALAAAAVGHRSYLRSLSSLAIRRDNQFRSNGFSSLVPVFSGHLIRRIKMLHSMDGTVQSSSRSRRNIMTAMISMSFVALGFAAVATRGIAQTPAVERKATPIQSPDEVQKAGTGTVKQVSLTKSVTAAKPGADPTLQMFGNSPLDPASGGGKDQQGMIAVRVQELLKRQALRTYAPVLNGLLSTWIVSELKLKTPPPVNVEAIEWISALPVVKFQAETKDQKSLASFGIAGFRMKLNQPADLKQWFSQYSPNSPHVQIEGKDVYHVVTSLGPVPTYLWSDDETTIRFCFQQEVKISSSTRLSDLTTVSERKNPVAADDEGAARWASTWNRIDRGLISLVLTKADFSGLLADFESKPDFQSDSMQKIGRTFRTLMSRCQGSGVSIDVTDKPSLLGIRITLMHSSFETATQSAQDVRDILTVAKQEIASNLGSLKDSKAEKTEKESLQLLIDAFDDESVSVSEYDNRSASTVISTAIPLSKFIELVVLSLNE